MKQTILTLSTAALITGSLFSSCGTPTEKTTTIEKTTTTIEPGQPDPAQQQYIADMESYRKANAERIAANEKSLAELKVKIETEKADAKAESKKKLAELEEKNNELKKKLDEYKYDTKENWESFKSEFGHDMDGLGKSFKDITVDNVK